MKGGKQMGRATTPTREDPLLLIQERILRGINEFVHLEVSGSITGLVFGKQLGVTLFAFATVKLGLADLPEGLSWKHIYGASWLGGIGFTMSLFVASLAFRNSPQMISQAKLAILVASLIAGAGGFLLLQFASRRSNVEAIEER